MLRRWRGLARALSTGCPVSHQARPAPSATPIASTRPFQEIPGPVGKGPLGTLPEFMGRAHAPGNMLTAVASFYNEFGPIVRHDFAGEKEVWIYDPVETLKVMTKQGKIPWTAAVEADFLDKYREERKIPLVLTGMTQKWKTDRTVLQKDLFNPPDAASYAPSLDPVVRVISRAAPKFERLSDMTSFAALDMFCSIMLGFCPNCTAGEVGEATCEPGDKAFALAAVKAMELLTSMSRDPVARQNITAHPQYKLFCDTMDQVRDGATRYVERLNGGFVRIAGVPSYFERLLTRGEMDHEECVEAVKTFLFAGVDTTHHVLLWLLLNLAQNPAVQDKLHAEFQAVLGDGALEVQHLSKMPYLSQCMRESHRLTPIGPGTLMRRLEEDVDVCGFLVPAGTKLMMMGYPVQNDPRFVDQPTAFLPERWNDEATQKRKGTPNQVIDHQLLAKPFGYGARMCIGSRAAELEIKTLLSRLVRDWRFTVRDPKEEYQIAMGAMLKASPFPRLKFEARKK